MNDDFSREINISDTLCGRRGGRYTQPIRQKIAKFIPTCIQRHRRGTPSEFVRTFSTGAGYHMLKKVR